MELAKPRSRTPSPAPSLTSSRSSTSSDDSGSSHDGGSLFDLSAQWAHERVHGHEIMPGTDKRIAKALTDAMARTKEDRRRRKREIAAQMYEERSRFAPEAERGDLRKTAEGTRFLDRFGVDGHYQQQLEATQVTSAKVFAALRLGRALEMVDNPGQQQTHLYHKGKHVLTLHRGASAFYEHGAPTKELPRQQLRKHGSDKEYVLDDRKVPTRRYAYAIKDSNQVGILDRGDKLKGRFISMLGRTSVMEATDRERAELGRTAPEIAARQPAFHSENDMLFLHQEFGSDNRQRGVSISSTANPLLSNEGRGFARPDDPGASKLKIDLARVPPRSHKGAVPNVVNLYHRIPGHEARRVTPPALHWTTHDPVARGQEVDRSVPLGARDVKFPADQGARRWHWSTGKNRELFLRELEGRHIVGQDHPSNLERTKVDLDTIEEEYRGAKAQRYDGRPPGPAPRRKPRRKGGRKR